MIVYRLPLGHDADAAARCRLPLTARLLPARPWTVRETPAGLELALHHPAHPTRWPGPGAAWQRSADGLEWCQVGDPWPLHDLRQPCTDHDREVELACGEWVMVQPAILDGFALGLDARPRGASSRYGRLAIEVSDALAAGTLPWNAPQILELCRTALATRTRLTAELIHEVYGLLGTADLAPIATAVWAGPRPAAAAPS